jgi:hypothetical protein
MSRLMEYGMLLGRPGFVRMAAVAIASASCLAATACGGIVAASLRPIPSIRGAVDPLARLPASKIAAQANANAEAAQTLTMTGTATESGASFALTLGFKRGVGCAGTVEYSGKGSIKLLVIGKDIYIKPDAKFWSATAGAKASAIIVLLGGRYLEAPASDKNMAGVASVCSVSKMLNSGSSVSYTKEAVTTYRGARVLPLKLSDGSTEYVTDTSKPEFVRAYAPESSQVGPGNVTISVGAPVTLTAPPASQVINESALGISPGPAQPASTAGPSLT